MAVPKRTRDVELHVEPIPEGSKVWINYAAANHDPEVFEEPDTFDIHRSIKRHMAFGLGVHFCIGAQLQGLKQSGSNKLRERIPNLELLDTGRESVPFSSGDGEHCPWKTMKSSPTLMGWIIRDVVITLVVAAGLTLGTLCTADGYGWVSGALDFDSRLYCLLRDLLRLHEWGHYLGALLQIKMPLGPYKGGFPRSVPY